MATNLGTLMATVGVDTRPLKKGLKDAEHQTKASTGRMLAHWKAMAVGIVATYALYKTARLVKETALLAARFETLDIVMKTVGKNAGYSAEQMDQYDLALRKTGISMIESRRTLAMMTQAQLDLSKATQLGRIAQDAAVIGNINSSEAFQRMIYGIQTGNLVVLRRIGINVSFEKSYKAVAEATNRTTTSFSESEKAMIRQNAVIQYGTRIAGTYEAAMGTAGKKLTSFVRYVEDFKVKMGKAFGPATVMLVDAATEAMKDMQEQISRPEVQESLRVISGELSDIVITLGKELPSKIANITKKAELLWKITTYDPAIIEFGVIGLVLFGRQGGKYVAYIAAMAHFATWAGVLGKAMGLVATGILDISQVATANFKELEELVKRFDFPDPFLDLQLQAKELKERIKDLKKVTEGRIFTFRGDREELVSLQEKLKDIQAAIETLKKAKVLDLIPDEVINQAERLKQALADPDKYYGAKIPESDITSNVYEQTDKMKRRYAKYYADLEEMEDHAYIRTALRERERLAEYQSFIDARLALEEAARQEKRDFEIDKLAMTKQMYSDLKFTSDDYYAYQLNQLQRQSDDYEKFTGNTVLAHLWLTEQIKALDKERLEAADKSNQYLIDLSQRTADAMEDNFSSFYRDFFRRELDSAADYFRKFCHSLTDSFSDMLGQMTKEMLFGGGSSGSSGLFKSLFSGVGSLFRGGDTANKSSLAIKVQSAALTDQSTIVGKLTSDYINFEKGASSGMEDLTDSTNIIKKITGVFANDRIVSSQIYIPLLTIENTKLMQQQLIISQLTAGYQRLYAIKKLTAEQQAWGAQAGGAQTQLDSPDAMNNPLTWYEKMVNAGKNAYEWLAKIGSSVWSGLKYLWSGVQNIYGMITAWISKIPVIGPLLGKVGAFLGKIPGIGVLLKWIGGFFGGSTALGAAKSAQAAMAITVLHAGGIVGETSHLTRVVNPNIFANAQHYAGGGIVGGEVPIIAHRGEGVFTQSQMNALGGRRDADEVEKAVQGTFGLLCDGLKNTFQLVAAGTESIFSELRDDVQLTISQIAQILPSRGQLSSLQAHGGSFSGMFQSLLSESWAGGFPTAGGTLTGGLDTSGVDLSIPSFHKGGRVGRAPAPTRMMPASLFAHAPRLHEGYSGLKNDEFPAILKYNETVLPPGVKPINKTQNTQNTTISVPVTVNADRRLSARLQVEIENVVKSVMREEMR